MIIGYEAKRIFHNSSGLGNYGRNLITALGQYYPENEYLLYNFKKAKVSYPLPASAREIRPRSKGKLLANLWRQRLVSGRARKDGVEIFHGLGQELPFGLKSKSIKTVVTVHDLIFLRYPKLYKRIDRNIYRKKLKHACLVADLVVAISRQTRQDLIDLLQVSPEKIAVIYQGCDPIYWEDHKNAFDLVKSKYNLPEKFTLFVGTLEPRKNPDKLARACCENNIPLVLVGRSTPFWENFLKSLSPREKSLLHPLAVNSNAHLAAIYQMATVFAYPSVFEGFGIPVLEALASKTPVLTGNNSALKEIAGPASVTIDVNQQQAINQELWSLWKDESRQALMKEQGFNFARQFTNQNIARQWIETYRQILGK